MRAEVPGGLSPANEDQMPSFRFAPLGTTIAVLSVGLDLSFQQLIAYPLRPVMMAGGEVGRGVSYSLRL